MSQQVEMQADWSGKTFAECLEWASKKYKTISETQPGDNDVVRKKQGICQIKDKTSNREFSIS